MTQTETQTKTQGLEAIKASLIASIERLRARGANFTHDQHDGIVSSIYLDPENQTIYHFEDSKSAQPMRAHHNIDYCICSLPPDVVSEKVPDKLLEFVDTFAEICTAYLGSEWKDSNYIGRWDDEAAREAATPLEDMAFDSWMPADDFLGGNNPTIEKMYLAGKSPKEIFEELYIEHPSEGAVLDADDLRAEIARQIAEIEEE